MSKTVEINYEQMFMKDYEDYVFRNLTSEKFNPNLTNENNRVIDVVSDVAKGVGSLIGESASEYKDYLQKTPPMTAAKKTGVELAKGSVSGGLGSFGDVEGIGRGIINSVMTLIQTKEGQNAISEFLKGFEETALPTTENIKSKIENVTGETPKGLGFVEGVGEMLGPVGVAKATLKAVPAVSKKLRSKKAKND